MPQLPFCSDIIYSLFYSYFGTSSNIGGDAKTTIFTEMHLCIIRINRSIRNRNIYEPLRNRKTSRSAPGIWQMFFKSRIDFLYSLVQLNEPNDRTKYRTLICVNNTRCLETYWEVRSYTRKLWLIIIENDTYVPRYVVVRTWLT